MADTVPPADEPTDPRAEGAPQEPGAPQAAETSDDQASTSAYLPVGIVFMSVAVVFFLNESMRTMAWAFFPLGITFLVLGTRSGGAGGARTSDGTTAPEGPGPGQDAPGPGVTPR